MLSVRMATIKSRRATTTTTTTRYSLAGCWCGASLGASRRRRRRRASWFPFLFAGDDFALGARGRTHTHTHTHEKRLESCRWNEHGSQMIHPVEMYVGVGGSASGSRGLEFSSFSLAERMGRVQRRGPVSNVRVLFSLAPTLFGC